MNKNKQNLNNINKENTIENLLKEQELEKLEYEKIPIIHKKAIDKILKKDPLYFKSISSKIGLKSDLINLSTYRYDYKNHNLNFKNKLIKKKSETYRKIIKPKQNIISSNKWDFNKKNLIKETFIKKSINKISKNIKPPPTNKSNYKDDYIRYNNSILTKQINPLKFENKIKLPFLGYSSNRNYGNFSNEQFNLIRKNLIVKKEKEGFKNLFGSHITINKTSTYHLDFKKNKEVDKLKFDTKKDNLETNLPFLKNHFKTTNMDYDKKEINRLINNPKELKKNKKIKKTKIY